MGATSDDSDIELNDETDEEDMVDGETGFDDGSVHVRNFRDPGQPTVKEHQEHMTDHTSTIQIMGKFCVMGRVLAHRTGGRMLKTTWKESEEQVSPLLVIRERRHKMTWALLVPRKGTEFPWIAKRAAKFIDQLGHNRVTLRCDNEPAIEAVAMENRTSSRRRKPDGPRDRQWEKASPTGSLNVRWGSLLARSGH